MEKIELFSDKISSFAQIGNKYICLKKDKELGILELNGKFTLLSQDVDRFFCDGHILIQKGNNICILDEHKIMRTLLEGVTGSLVGAKDNKIYLYGEDSINIYDMTSKTFGNAIPLSKNEILKALYIFDDTYELALYNKDSIYSKTFKTVKR